MGWRGQDGEWRRDEELPMNLKGEEEVSAKGELPATEAMRIAQGRMGALYESRWFYKGWADSLLFMQRLVNCSR